MRRWMFALAAFLSVLALAGCGQATSIPSTTVASKGTPTASGTAKTAMPVGKTIATKPSGNATSAPTAKPKTGTGSSTGPIAFVLKQAGILAIYVMNADGSNPTRVTEETTANAVAPAWSPDGKRIVYMSGKGSAKGTGELYIINADGSGEVRLTNNEDLDYSPAWSPDGSQIVFGAGRNGNLNLYVINVDGSGEAQLNSEEGVETYAKWSPDGKKIIYCSTRDSVKNEIYVMNADGSEVQRLTNNQNIDMSPVFSPDGTKIVYISDKDGKYEVYVMNADGSKPQQLTKGETHKVESVSWSPDDKYIVYTSPGADGAGREIYIMNADGSNQRQLTDSADDKSSVTWAPK